MKVLYHIDVCAIDGYAFSLLHLFSVTGTSEPEALRRKRHCSLSLLIPSRLLERGDNKKQTAAEAVLLLF